jgi:hypothetical protein
MLPRDLCGKALEFLAAKIFAHAVPSTDVA